MDMCTCKTHLFLSTLERSGYLCMVYPLFPLPAASLHRHSSVTYSFYSEPLVFTPFTSPSRVGRMSATVWLLWNQRLHPPLLGVGYVSTTHPSPSPFITPTLFSCKKDAFMTVPTNFFKAHIHTTGIFPTRYTQRPVVYPLPLFLCCIIVSITTPSPAQSIHLTLALKFLN